MHESSKMTWRNLALKSRKKNTSSSSSSSYDYYYSPSSSPPPPPPPPPPHPSSSSSSFFITKKNPHNSSSSCWCKLLVPVSDLEHFAAGSIESNPRTQLWNRQDLVLRLNFLSFFSFFEDASAFQQDCWLWAPDYGRSVTVNTYSASYLYEFARLA